MTKNPIINALVASLYITLVASIMFYGSRMAGPNNVETVVIPIAMISLFTLSAAVMGYLFLLTPARMYLDGNKEDSVKLFLKTLGAFAIITTIFFFFLFLKISG